ncbi:hypothetical protein PILCRDRAFT_271287 [Piloderma croceum F 1598]|uniref:Uncharacterized protein n=1 Tax=Piloderma croceum (strain F 1598) TaxID=765440 RepID=A0A0C3CC90_PILCF|nr:hypothetical protein PILCRDRAFT_271287 [Piloderma croceum F 1598]
MSSAGVDKTLDASMKSGEVIRPDSTVDSCDSLEPKVKGKRKRETGEEDKLNAEIDMPILRSDCDKTERKDDSQTIQAAKRVRQDDVDYTDQVDIPTSVEALEDDECKADQGVLNQGLDGISSQDHAASSVPDRAMPETLQKGTVDRSAAADLHQQSREVEQPTGQLPTTHGNDALMKEALQKTRSTMSGLAQLPMMRGFPGLPSSYHEQHGTQGLGNSAMSHASTMPGDLSSFLSQMNDDKFLQGFIQGRGLPESSAFAPGVPCDSEDDILKDLISETRGSDMTSMIPGYPSGTLP